MDTCDATQTAHHAQVPPVTNAPYDFWHGQVSRFGPYDGFMPRIDVAVGAGLFSTLMSGVVGIPVLMGLYAGNDLTVLPAWLWVTGYIALLVAQIATSWLIWLMPRRMGLAVYGACVVLGPVVVLGAPGAGWLPIILVLTAAIGSYLLPASVMAAIIGLNTVVVGVAASVQSGKLSEIVFSALIYGVIQTATVMSVFATVRESRTRQELAVAHAELKATSAALAETSRSAERLRIARDLHDAVGHQLTALTLELEVASHRPDEAASHVARSRTIARDLLDEVRAVVSDLRLHPPDLRDAIETIVEDIPEPEVRMDIESPLPVDEERVLALVRCVQEIVTNAIKHSAARTLWIDVRHEGDEVVLNARDNGVAHGVVAPGGGLTSIAERAAQLGGTSHFAAHSGFIVEVRIPAT